GFALFEYVDPEVTDIAIQSLNGMELGDQYLVVQRASVGAKGMPDMHSSNTRRCPPGCLPAGTRGPEADTRTRVDTRSDTPPVLEYGDLYEDVKEECSNCGTVEDLRIPPPGESTQEAARIDEASGVGRVYVKCGDG
ncbi:hypothetical protein BDZ89DRAFT_935844, partial [Hymenopellis radicata]